MPRKPAPNKAPKATNKSVTKSAPMVPGRNGGMIRHGSLPGNTPGTGRPPNALRDAMRGDLDKLLPGLWKKYEDEEIDALEFANFLAKYGLGTKDELNLADDPRVKRTIQRVAELVLEIAGPEAHATIAARLAAEGL